MMARQDQKMDDVGTMIINKQDGLLYRRSTRYASRTVLYKGEFTDDMVLLPWSRDTAYFAIKANVEVESSLSSTVSFSKMMVAGVTELQTAGSSGHCVCIA